MFTFNSWTQTVPVQSYKYQNMGIFRTPDYKMEIDNFTQHKRYVTVKIKTE